MIVSRFLTLFAFVAVSVSLAYADPGEKKAAGYRLSGIAPGSLYERIGLKNGDTILEWNGKPLKSAELGKAWAKSVRENGPVTLKILRDGKVKTISYSLK